MYYDILIIHESAAIRQRYIQALQTAAPPGLQYAIVTVNSVVAGQLQASRQRFDLVIATLGRDNQGIELAQSLKDLYPGQRFLLLHDQTASMFQIRLAGHLGARLAEDTVTDERLHHLVVEMLDIPPPAPEQPVVEQRRQLAQPPQRSQEERSVRIPQMLAPSQHDALRKCLAEFGRQAGIRCVLLADLSGQEIAIWNRLDVVDAPSVAALAASDLMATIEINRVLGGQRSCKLIVQEHEDQTIVMGRAGNHMMVMLATECEIPLGWTRMAIKRLIEQILLIVEGEAIAPQPVAFSNDFEAQFAAQIAEIW